MRNILHSCQRLWAHRLFANFSTGNFFLCQGLMACKDSMDNLKFDNQALRRLPIDPLQDNKSRITPGACFSRVKPIPVENPKVVCISQDAMDLLDLQLLTSHVDLAAQYFSGNKLFTGSETAAHCYCGHQFGYFSGQLGDGAAMYLGEVVNSRGERWELQLKGAGRTPYSRQADGRKVLRSSIREFLCSEALHYLGIPTTRAGSCVTSDSTVMRDLNYDGNAIPERCSIVSRIAPTFIRFGSFEIFKPPDDQTGRQGPSVGRKDILETLLNYCVESFYPEIWQKHINNSDKVEMYLEFVRAVSTRTAQLVAHWQSVGWCHGVLNTDNMSIVGVTIDYGPFGFMDRYDPDFICNSSDENGRYTYSKQPEICKWNLEKLCEAIQMIVPLEKSKEQIQVFDSEFKKFYLELMRKKFGLKTLRDDDEELFKRFFSTMKDTGADFTSSFRCLSTMSPPGSPDHEQTHQALSSALLQQCWSLDELKDSLKPKVDPTQIQMIMQMLQTNPSIARQLGSLMSTVRREMDNKETLKQYEDKSEEDKQSLDKEKWSQWLNEYRARLKIDVSDMDEQGLQAYTEQRRKLMNSTNPKFVLRNFIAQLAIDAAEANDFSLVEAVLNALKTPYSDETADSVLLPDRTGRTRRQQGAEEMHKISSRPPVWANSIKVS